MGLITVDEILHERGWMKDEPPTWTLKLAINKRILSKQNGGIHQKSLLRVQVVPLALVTNYLVLAVNL